MVEIKASSLQETAKLGEQLGELLDAGDLILLSGDLGAGKTTFTKSIGKALGVTKVINSPTFTILKSYQGRVPLYHIDAYRLEGITQDLGFEEVFDGDGVCVIEWADFLREQLPAAYLEIEIRRLSEEARLFILHPQGARYEQIVRELV